MFNRDVQSEQQMSNKYHEGCSGNDEAPGTRGFMVGDTGIEPVTLTVSRLCRHDVVVAVYTTHLVDFDHLTPAVASAARCHTRTLHVTRCQSISVTNE
jgi:hypothetical protein